MRIFLTFVLLVAMSGLQVGLGTHTRADDQRLAVIVHPKAPVSSLSEDDLVAIFTMSRRRWSDGETIIVFNMNPGTGTRVQFDQSVLGMTPDQAARFWIDRRIRDGGASPLKTPNALTMLKVIASLPRSIGYVPEAQLGQAVKVVARVINGRVLPEKKGPQR
jgi:ABC-type phosphate transport system substrate-binding protein